MASTSDSPDAAAGAATTGSGSGSGAGSGAGCASSMIGVICVVSACPFDLNLDGWTTNSPERGPTGLEVEFLGA